MQKILRYCRQDKQEGMEYREYLRIGRQDIQEDRMHRSYLHR